MNTSFSNHEYRAIVIAGKYESFKVDVTHLLVRHGIEVTFCDSVYAAAGEFAHLQANEHLLAVGSLVELSKEAGSFYQICSRKDNVTCLCFINRPGKQHKIVGTAVRQGALVVSDMDDFQKEIDEWLKERSIQVKSMLSSKPQTGKVTKEELTVSQSELKALLEGD
jgi:hypothetical protein